MILAAFRTAKLGRGPYTVVDIALQVLNRKSAQKNQKIDRTSICRHLIVIFFYSRIEKKYSKSEEKSLEI